MGTYLPVSNFSALCNRPANCRVAHVTHVTHSRLHIHANDRTWFYTKYRYVHVCSCMFMYVHVWGYATITLQVCLCLCSVCVFTSVESGITAVELGNGFFKQQRPDGAAAGIHEQRLPPMGTRGTGTGTGTGTHGCTCTASPIMCPHSPHTRNAIVHHHMLPLPLKRDPKGKAQATQHK